jgi:lysozyme family protein
MDTEQVMIDLFPAAMAFVFRPENDGQPFHVSPNDPGGATSFGVTFNTWAGWQRLHKSPVSMALFRECKQADFLPLYRAMFWNSCSCISMGAVGIQVFDAAVNCGPGHAAGFLQTVLSVRVDDQIGPLTLAVAQQTDQRALARQLCEQREEFYASRPGAVYFERGWDARAVRCRDLVLGILGVAATPKPQTSADSADAPLSRPATPESNSDQLMAAELQTLNPTPQS